MPKRGYCRQCDRAWWPLATRGGQRCDRLVIAAYSANVGMDTVS